MTTELLRLAERCEKASGPDTELDWAIINAIDPDARWAYTASLDAAMTLVPDRFAVHDLSDWTHDPEHLRPHWSVALWWLDVKRGVVEGEAATPALALCAAALRARSFLDDAND